MTQFDLKKYWNERYKNLKKYKHGEGSGIGSEGAENLMKANYANYVIAKYRVKSIIDYGCGAGNFTALIKGYQSYIGQDISPECVLKCRQRFITNTAIAFTTEYPSVSADMAVSMDVIFHQVNDADYFEYMAELFRHNLVLIYTINRNLPDMQQHMKIRLIEPYVAANFPSFELVEKKDVENNKSFYIYKKMHNLAK